MKGRCLVYLIGLLVFTSPTVGLAENFYFVKISQVHWSTTDFTFADSRLVFDNRENIGIGAEFTFKADNNIGFGVEFMFQDTGIMSNTNILDGTPNIITGYANVYHLNGIVKYFLSDSETYLPYIGLGIGRSKVSIHSLPNVIMYGDSLIAATGVSYHPYSWLSLSLDLKTAYMDVDNEYGFRLNTHYNAFQLGFIFLF